VRDCRKEVQQIFDRYIKNNVRRLKRDEALAMLKTEFNFSDEQANCMFTMFDKDKNDVMSIWEFQQFYMCVGNRSDCSTDHSLFTLLQELISIKFLIFTI